MPDPTKEEIEEMLRKAGFNGGWKNAQEQTLGMPKIMEESVKVLKTSKHLMEKQVESDKKAISDAHVALSRLEHGGGA